MGATEIEADWPVVTVFADAMRKRLEANADKGGWDDCDDDYLVAKLAEEFGELVILVRDPAGVDRLSGKVLREAADVANIAMMIADNFGGICAEADDVEDGRLDKARLDKALRIIAHYKSELATLREHTEDDDHGWDVPGCITEIEAEVEAIAEGE